VAVPFLFNERWEMHVEPLQREACQKPIVYWRFPPLYSLFARFRT